MQVPYGFDCFTFGRFEMRRFESNIQKVRNSIYLPGELNISQIEAHEGSWPNKLVDRKDKQDAIFNNKYIRFTRKNEDYTNDQMNILANANRLNKSEVELMGKQMFCGTKIQLGIGVVTNFLQMGMQYRKPIKGRAEIVNGTWRGIVSGLTKDANDVSSYDMAFGNFLAFDEEFPYMKFGPIYAIESKLVLLTGTARRIEASSFGTNIDSQLWLIILALIIILALMASLMVHWQQEKYRILDEAIRQIMFRMQMQTSNFDDFEERENKRLGGIFQLMGNFIFIYLTMLLQKPCIEFDDLIWPKSSDIVPETDKQFNESMQHLQSRRLIKYNQERLINFLNEMNSSGANILARHYREMINCNKRWRRMIPSSIRALSYIWSSSCFIMVSIYSGEMLAVILVHTDQNIDNIQQLINAQPKIQPVIRDDDFTYGLMLKSMDANMLKLHNLTQMIDRRQVYSRDFIEKVSNREQALLGDDELIETIYDIYSQHFPLYRSKTTYLQYPISMMYRKDLPAKLELELRRGIVQLFEMGLLERWNAAQKETLFSFYDKQNQERLKQTVKANNNISKETTITNQENNPSEASRWQSEQKYKPLSVNNFASFFKLFAACLIISLIVLIFEIIAFKFSNFSEKLSINQQMEMIDIHKKSHRAL